MQQRRGKVESEAQLRQITDEDINNIWYVRALKNLAEKEEGEGDAA